MVTKKITLSIVCFFSILQAFSQYKKLELANEKYNHMAYMDAARLYEVLIKKGLENEEVFKKLGNSYYFNAKFNLAEKWYTKLFLLNKEQGEETILRYLHTLKAIGDFEKLEELRDWQIQGIDITQKINLLNNNDSDYYFNYEADRIIIKIEDAGINTKDADYGATLIDGDIIFTSTRETLGSVKDIFEWTNRPFSKLYRANLATNEEFEKPKEFLKEIETKFNESTAVFSQDGKTMYFTRNSLLNNKEKKNNDIVMRLKLYRASNKEGVWTNVTELPFNSDDYNCAHPALSKDGKTLYFVSNMPGTYGASDLFKVTINEDNTYGKPQNLGNSINTMGRETFPYISKNNELFFSSDGHFGIGGLDVFVTKINSDKTFNKIQNVRDPINSSKDDFGFFINEGNNMGFFSSNRDGGVGSDDIYKFTIEPIFDKIDIVLDSVITKSITVNGVVSDAVNNENLENVKVILLDIETNKILDQTLTNEKGVYTFSVDENKYFRINFTLKTHTQLQEKFDSFNLSESSNSIQKNVLMKPILNTKVLANLDRIYFNSNDSYIRSDAALELDKVVTLMLKTYPEMIIKIEAHTDPVGSHIYNDWLSQRRAASAYKYLISKGVPKERIASYIGFGKRKPINKCTSLKDCEPSELELNRRTEFLIVKFRNQN